MNRSILLFLFLFNITMIAYLKASTPADPYSKRMVDDQISRSGNMTSWDYPNGLFVESVLQYYNYYGGSTYYNYAKTYADNTLNSDGTIKSKYTSTLTSYTLDNINPGQFLMQVYATEGTTKYKTALDQLRTQIQNQSRTAVCCGLTTGGFWHKYAYDNQMWLDGLYMADRFYANYAKTYNSSTPTTDYDDIVNQFVLIHSKTYNADKQLNYHAWSATPGDADSFWANSQAPFLGCSKNFWARGEGWYFAALVDVLEILPTNYSRRSELISILDQVAAGLKRWQDESGCWFQLLEYDENTISSGKPNYLEASASSMFTYAFLKAIRLGLISSSTYKTTSINAYNGLISNFISADVNGVLSVNRICKSAGLGPASDLSRDGSIEYYLNGSDAGVIVSNDLKGVGPFIMASMEYEKMAFDTQPFDNQSECINGSLTLGTVAAVDATSYQWFSNTTKSNIGGTSVGASNGGSTATFTPPSTTAGTFYYYCVATKGTILTPSSAVQITINPATAISSQSTVAANYVQNATATALTVTASGVGLSYQWYSSTDASTSTIGDDVTVGTNSNIFTPSTATLGTMYYYCVVSGTCGPASVSSNISGAIVTCTAPTFSTQPIDLQSECIGGILTLGTVVASDATSYQWYSNSTKTNSGGTTVGSGNGGNTATYTPPSTVAGTYYYYCVATSSSCSAPSTAIQITINAATAITSQSTSSANYSQNASATALTITATGTGLSYQWYSSTDASTSTIGDDITVGTNNNSYTPSTANLGTKYYYCVVTGGCAPITVTSNISGAISVTQFINILYLTATSTLSATDTQLYPNLIANSKYNLTKRAVFSTAQAASAYSAYDLIIISEDINSAQAEIVGLKTIDKNILSLKSFLLKSGSWSWGTPDNGKANSEIVTVKQPTHPIFNGITLTNGTLALLNGAVAKGIQPVDLTLTGGINVALAPKTASPYNLAVAIHDVPASVRGVSNSKFLLVAICNDSYAKMTSNTLTLINNAIDYLVNQSQFVPKPLYVRTNNGSWETSADNINWSLDVVIPSATTITDLTLTNSNAFTLSSNTSLNNLSIALGSTLIVPAAKQLTISTSMTNNGTLNLLSDATGTATIITPATISGSGTANVNQYLTTAVNGRNWYLSSPMSGATSNVVKSKSGSQLWSYSEANSGTVIWNEITATNVPLNLMQGYVARLATDEAITFSGSLNTGTKSMTGLTRTGTVSTGYNLVGNPYASYVNWNDAIKTNVSNSIWYRSKSTGAYIYQTYNVTGEGVGTNGGTNLIPPMQSFWVQVTSGTGSIEFQNSMRSHQDQSIVSNRLKAPFISTQKLLRLQVSNEINNDEAVIYFNENALNSFDTFDSPKMSNNNPNIPEIYTLVGNERLVINGLNSIESNKNLILGFTTLSKNNFRINASEISNMNADTKIILKDNLLDYEHDLTNGSSYYFSSESITTNDRFTIQFRLPEANTGFNDVNGSEIFIYRNSKNKIVINSKLVQNGLIIVTNALGQRIANYKVNSSHTEINNLQQPGVYIFSLYSDGVLQSTNKAMLN